MTKSNPAERSIKKEVLAGSQNHGAIQSHSYNPECRASDSGCGSLCGFFPIAPSHQFIMAPVVRLVPLQAVFRFRVHEVNAPCREALALGILTRLLRRQ